MFSLKAGGAKMPEGKAFTLSNAMSIFRVLLLGPIYLGLSQNTASGNLWALNFMLLAVLSDYFDGYLARKLQQESDWGRLLDPVADKICIFAVCLMLASPIRENPVPSWLLWVLVVREFIVVSGGYLIYRRKRVVVKSNIWGKSTSFVLALMLFSYMLQLQPAIIWLSWLNYNFLLWLSFSFIIVSTTSYGVRFYRAFFTSEGSIGSRVMKPDSAGQSTGSNRSEGKA
ncbi:hypothetical protein CEE37_05500 [candidate division LCP-89 bacterium B3_LCP]|uniref:CDP-diacylglycerol--glycerol-3-phosphate 3-phosphatidyltransferase n=1 Tax=candidate division LCP-89 bacterium B3_LCP TaxID=2012998 RepID=A0A532V1N6_UNCL8|nr:MAG: hypothetical protein CEE37_05500 [candidate division LCP-89 bacterium B3_LCP]